MLNTDLLSEHILDDILQNRGARQMAELEWDHRLHESDH
jgi:hypothetical protein